jgi:hypothetical protein
VAGAELGAAGAGDEPALFQDLEVLGDAGQGQVEGRSQFVDGGITGGQAGQDGAAGRVGQGRERGVEPSELFP